VSPLRACLMRISGEVDKIYAGIGKYAMEQRSAGKRRRGVHAQEHGA